MPYCLTNFVFNKIVRSAALQINSFNKSTTPCLFDDEEIAKRLKKKAIARKNEQKLEEDKKFRRDNNTPNKKIQHASAFSGSVNFLCGRLGIDASASRRVAQIYEEKQANMYYNVEV